MNLCPLAYTGLTRSSWILAGWFACMSTAFAQADSAEERIINELRGLKLEVAELRSEVRQLTANLDQSAPAPHAAAAGRSSAVASAPHKVRTGDLEQAIERGDIRFDAPLPTGNLVELTLAECWRQAEANLAQRSAESVGSEAVWHELRLQVTSDYWQLWSTMRTSDAMRVMHDRLQRIVQAAEKRGQLTEQQLTRLRNWEKQFDPANIGAADRTAHERRLAADTKRLRRRMGWATSNDQILYPVAPATKADWQPTWEQTKEVALMHNAALRKLTTQLRELKLTVANKAEDATHDEKFSLVKLAEEKRGTELRVLDELALAWRLLDSQNECARVLGEQWRHTADESDIYRERLLNQTGQEFDTTLDLFMRSTERELASRRSYFEAVAEGHKAVASMQFYCGGLLGLDNR